VLGRLYESLVEQSHLSIPTDQPGSAHPGLILPLTHV
jgi:hypothetical protein